MNCPVMITNLLKSYEEFGGHMDPRSAAVEYNSIIEKNSNTNMSIFSNCFANTWKRP
jgi:hypothetical protein